MATVTVSIGRNIGDEPMSERSWGQFRDKTHARISALASDVFVQDAASIGRWEGIAEESRTWVAAVPVDMLPLLKRDMARLCADFEQDAIAVTVGDTELVSA